MQPKSVIRTYYFISGMYTLGASIIWGINTLFLLRAGLDIFEVFIANGAFSAGMVIFEIPTGVFADTKGRRFSFLFSVAVLLVTTLGYMVGYYIRGNVIWFAAFSVFLGLGYTFYSGAVEAWVVDELKAVNHKGKLDSIFSGASIMSGITMLVGTVGGGVLGTFDIAIPYMMRSGILLLLLIISFFLMKERGFTSKKLKGFRTYMKEMKSIAAASIRFGWKVPVLKHLMVVSFIQMSFFMWAFYAFQPFFLDLIDMPEAVWISGTIVAAMSLFQMVGNLGVAPLLKVLKKRSSVLILAAIIAAASVAALGYFSSFWISLALLLPLMAANGLYGPVKQGFMHDLIPSEQRATVISFDSLIANAGGMGGQSGFGYLGKVVSLSAGYVTGGAVLLLSLPFLFLIKREKVSADET